MPWQLDIHVLDVGQGDSSLIVASDPAAGLRRVMLIDGGEPQCAEMIHDYYNWFFLGVPPPLDHMVLTHYNEDHGGGLRMLLQADDLDDIITALTAAGAAAAGTAAALAGGHRPSMIAAVTAGVYSRGWGNTAAQAQADVTTALLIGNVGDNAAVTFGVNSVTVAPPGAPNAMLAAPVPRRRVARVAALAAANNAAAAPAVLATLIRQAIYGALAGGMPANARFETAGIYTATNVIDLGNRNDTPAAWPGVITGNFIHGGGNLMRAPSPARPRTSMPALGSEVLWNSGPHPIPAPAGAPAAYVVSRNSRVWQGAGAAPLQFNSGQADNDSCIGLLIRFNNFVYFTAGDLPTQGEDPLATAASHHGLPLPNPAAGTYPPSMGFNAIKCGHHGAATATSDPFLQTTMATGAFISCGFNPAYGHPSGAVITSLNNSFLEYYYLTNCNFAYPEVPASQIPQLDQITAPNNKSRVCGDNNPVNMAPFRNRGDIWLQITQAQSILAPGAGQYSIRYWENTHPPAGFRNENVTL